MNNREIKEYNCGFTNDNKWFRYRAAAIIVEDGYVLFAGNEKEDYYYSIGGAVHMGETAEDALDEYRTYPTFMKQYLQAEHHGVEHIVFDERTNQ